MKKFAIEIKWAMIFTGISLLWTTIEKLSGLHDLHIDKEPLYSTIFAIPAIAVFVLMLQEKKRKVFFGQMTWTQGFISGCYASLFIAILNPISQILAFEVISPDFLRNMSSYQIAHKRMTREVADAYFDLKSYIVQATLSGLSMGIITSALVALLVKTKKDPSNEK